MAIIPGSKWGTPQEQIARYEAERRRSGASPHPWAPRPGPSDYENAAYNPRGRDRRPRTRPAGRPGYGQPGGPVNPHGLGNHDYELMQQMHARLDAVHPGLAKTGGGAMSHTRAAKLLEGFLPEGASLGPGGGQSLAHAAGHAHRNGQAFPGGAAGNIPGGGHMYSQDAPYQPEYASSDRQFYPTQRQLANLYWRMFYKLDPHIGNVIDMKAEMLQSDYGITGEGVTGEVKDRMELAREVSGLDMALEYIPRELDVIGEAGLHLIWNDDEGIWSHVGFQDPDRIEVYGIPQLDAPPLYRYRPEPGLRQFLSMPHPMVQKWRESMPPEVLSSVMSGEPIDLSPVNFTLLARKLHPYDLRGTSEISRMWRVLMYEDAAFEATLQILRRHAGPLKVAKLGDPSTGYVPHEEQWYEFQELLAQAELDVNSWLVYHFGLQFDLVGSSDRVETIDKHLEPIERLKLVAMGVSKAFLHGEVTYASAQSGLTVMLKRLQAKRKKIVDSWLMPKFYRQMSVMNQWVKPTEAEASSVRTGGPMILTRRTARELWEDQRYIVPTLEWESTLDPEVDTSKINAISQLEGLGVKFSKRTKMSLVGRDWEDETRQLIEETQVEQQLLEQYPAAAQALTGPVEEGGPALGGGGPLLPPMGGGDLGEELPEGPEGPTDVEGEAGSEDESARPSYGSWQPEQLEALAELLRGERPEVEPWKSLLAEAERGAEEPALAWAMADAGDPEGAWLGVNAWLLDEGVPTKEISSLEDYLRETRLLYRS